MGEPRRVQRHWNPELAEAAPEQRIGVPRPDRGDEPKSDAGNRIVALDADGLKVSKRHIKRV